MAKSEQPALESFSQLLSPWIGELPEFLYLVLDTLLIFFAAIAVQFFAVRAVRLALKAAHKTRNYWDVSALEALKKPLILLVWGVAISSVLIKWLPLLHLSDTSLVEDIRRSTLLAAITWFVWGLVYRVEKYMLADDTHQSQFDQTTINAFSKAIRCVIVVVGVLLLLQSFNYNISSLLAVGSIGGIAISFAAKDLLANFFGGLMIYLDRPFSIGDWVRSPDREIEGTVEHIGWRRTVIRTFDKRPLYVPNSVFTNIAVENPSRMSNRRFYETIGIRYSDAINGAAIVADVKAMLKAHEAIDTNQTMIVNINKFADSSIEFFIYTFTKTTNWVEFHEIKQQLLMEIYQIIQSHGAEVAFPTQTIELNSQ